MNRKRWPQPSPPEFSHSRGWITYRYAAPSNIEVTEPSSKTS